MVDISIHVPRMGDDRARWGLSGLAAHFYPRPPYGGRPGAAAERGRQPSDFYPRPPYGGRLRTMMPSNSLAVISIHVPRMGDDRGQLVPGWLMFSQFLSTSPVWGTTAFSLLLFAVLCYFYPRPPYGGRHHHQEPPKPGRTDFYPRPPYGGRRRPA